MAAMSRFRIPALGLAVLHAMFAGLTAPVGLFADGGDLWQRLVLVLLHPLGAAGVLLLVLRSGLARTTIVGVAALLLVNVVADVTLARMIATGAVRGDWELAAVFAVVPAIGIVYALGLLRAPRTTG